jgi:hypothetical protein
MLDSLEGGQRLLLVVLLLNGSSPSAVVQDSKTENYDAAVKFW